MALIDFHGVSKTYQQGEVEIHALRGIELSIQTGEFVAVWGPSGSGKSTLCNLIGLLDAPTEGSVKLRGQAIHSLSDDRCSELRNRFIGFVFQSFNLIPVLSALENVMLPLQIQGRSTADARPKALRRLRMLGIAEYSDQRPHQLSGGQQQRVAIARALVTDPDLVIADEPTANLDSETAIRIIDLMREINQADGTTFIFSTHDQRLLSRVNRLIQLTDGSIIGDKSSDPVLQTAASSVG